MTRILDQLEFNRRLKLTKTALKCAAPTSNLIDRLTKCSGVQRFNNIGEIDVKLWQTVGEETHFR